MRITHGAVRIAMGLAIVAGPTMTTLATHAPTASSAPATARLAPVALRVTYDLPARPLRDEFPANRLLAEQRRYNPAYKMEWIKQCGVYALNMVDLGMGQPDFTMQIRLNRIYAAAHPHDTAAKSGIVSRQIDDAARLLHYRVDHTPAIGAVVIFEPGWHRIGNTWYRIGSTGHAAKVARIDTVHGTFYMQQYNVIPYRYSMVTERIGDVSEFVHFHR